MDDKLREIARKLSEANGVVDDAVGEMCAYVNEVKAENRELKKELIAAYKLIVELRLELKSKLK